jgi:hypothetical protein
MVAMTAVNAIPYVLDAPPGVVVPPVFGAYRWIAPRVVPAAPEGLGASR